MIVHGFISDELVERLWSKLPKGNKDWSKSDGASLEAFRAELKGSPIVIELDFGYIRVERFIYGYEAVVHGAFWNKDVFRKKEEVIEVARRISALCKAKRIKVLIPEKHRSLRKLLDGLGLEHLGYGFMTRTIEGKQVPGDLWVLRMEG